jgi:hypothetical protein
MADRSIVHILLGTDLNLSLAEGISDREDGPRTKLSALMAGRSGVHIALGTNFDHHVRSGIAGAETGLRPQQTGPSAVRFVNGRNAWVDYLQGPASATHQAGQENAHAPTISR